jgi:hypothetical protein
MVSLIRILKHLYDLENIDKNSREILRFTKFGVFRISLYITLSKILNRTNIQHAEIMFWMQRKFSKLEDCKKKTVANVDADEAVNNSADFFDSLKTLGLLQ